MAGTNRFWVFKNDPAHEWMLKAGGVWLWVRRMHWAVLDLAAGKSYIRNWPVALAILMQLAIKYAANYAQTVRVVAKPFNWTQLALGVCQISRGTSLNQLV